MMRFLLLAVLAGALLMVGGCGSAAEPTPPATPTKALSPTPERPLPAEPRSPEDMPDVLIERARADLVARLGLAPAGVTGAAVTQPVVPAESLGCPLTSTLPSDGKKLVAGAPGTVTVQEVRLVTAQGIHVYRFDGERMVYCGKQ